MTSTPTPEPGERDELWHDPDGCPHGDDPAICPPCRRTAGMKCTVCDGSGRTPSPTGVPMIGATSCAGCFGTGCRPAPSTPGEGTGRPDTAQLREAATNAEVGGIVDETIITAAADWIDAQPPASPADDVPDADAVAFQNGYRIGVRVGSEHHGPCRGLPPASPVPPTPTPCPYIVTGGEGTSYCSLAERSAMHAAAPPSTPADPRPTDLTGSEA